MRANCVTITMDLLADQGGRFVAAGSRRGPLMHVWHEAADGTVTRYEPDAPLRHWTHALGGYPGHTVDYPQAAARPVRAWQIVASCWVLAITASAWALLRAIRRPFSQGRGMLRRLIKIGDALSQLANATVLAGDPNESISGRSYRCGWRRSEAFIDWLFSPFQSNHCLKAYTNDVERARRLVAEHEARVMS